MTRRHSLLFVGLLFLFGCGEERKETPTKGKVTVAVAESVFPVLEQEQQKFEELYPEAHVDLHMTTSREAIALLFNDSVSVIVSARPLNTEERGVAKSANLTFGEFKLAIDGIAVIVNNENPVKQLRTTQIDSILNGSLTDWKKAGWNGSASPIAVCLPDRNTGTFDSLSLYTKHDEQQMHPVKITASSSEMIHFVHEHENAIGFVGVNWYSSQKDSVKALALNDPSAPDSLGIKGKYFGPHQAYMYQKFYPLIKDVYIYTRGDIYGVASGFTSFMTSSAGQKIILNSGLVPATMPVRLVEITNRSL